MSKAKHSVAMKNIRPVIRRCLARRTEALSVAVGWIVFAGNRRETYNALSDILLKEVVCSSNMP